MPLLTIWRDIQYKCEKGFDADGSKCQKAPEIHVYEVEAETKILGRKKAGGNIGSSNGKEPKTSNPTDKGTAKPGTSALSNKDNESSKNTSTTTGNQTKGQLKGIDNVTGDPKRWGAGNGQ